jgi:cytosine/adenosine deaminase-related metal-dependent hydrolase
MSSEAAMILHATTALLPTGWADAVRIRVADGRIVEVTPDAAPLGAVHPCVLPAPVNLHSHTFQRAMAGMTEARTAGQDTFWTWRSLMYRFLDHLTPEDVEAIAALAMVEMAEAGFAAVAEFHYLHHQPGGAAYDHPAEMSARIAAAADQTGLGLTLLPVMYEQGGCDGRSLQAGQLRFRSGSDRFEALIAGAAARTGGAIAVGQWADILALDMGDVALDGHRGDTVLDAWIFAGRDGLVTDLWSAGRHIVTGGRHRARSAVEARYRKTLAALRDRL